MESQKRREPTCSNETDTLAKCAGLRPGTQTRSIQTGASGSRWAISKINPKAEMIPRTISGRFAQIATKVCKTLHCQSRTRSGFCLKFAGPRLTIRKLCWSGCGKSFQSKLKAHYATRQPLRWREPLAFARALASGRNVTILGL